MPSLARGTEIFQPLLPAARFFCIKKLSPRYQGTAIFFLFSQTLPVYTGYAVLLAYIILAVGKKAAVGIGQLFTEHRLTNIAQKLCLILTAAAVCQNPTSVPEPYQTLPPPKGSLHVINHNHLAAVSICFYKCPGKILNRCLAQNIPPGHFHLIFICQCDQHHPIAAVLVQLCIYLGSSGLDLLRPSGNPVLNRLSDISWICADYFSSNARTAFLRFPPVV